MEPVDGCPSRPTPIGRSAPSMNRLLHGLDGRNLGYVLRRIAEVSLDVFRAEFEYYVRPVPPAPQRILRWEEGRGALADARRIAVYLHFCPTDQISKMVLRQLEAYRALGFSIVFVTMTAAISAPDWKTLGDLCALVVQRRSYGRDFGALKDVLAGVLGSAAAIDELLVVNDSVLGPIAPLEPVFRALRAGGEGAFGLTESLGGGSHLQSYLLLVRGRRAIDVFAQFIAALRLTTSKWQVVQAGEIGLSRYLSKNGIAVGALYPYALAANAGLEDQMVTSQLGSRYPVWRTLSEHERVAWLSGRPLNPTHFFWRGLLQRGFPFIKTELIRRNPGGIAGVEEWRSLITADSPCSVDLIEQHLGTLSPS